MQTLNWSPFAGTFLASAALLAGVPAVHAAEPEAGTEPTAAPVAPAPDKNQYNLFNPTPPSLLRDMDTDRPNITNTPHTVDAGHLQIEGGPIDYSFFRHHAVGGTLRQDDWAFGQLNFRLGVLNNLEVNAIINPFEMDRTRGPFADHAVHAGGFGDTVIGGKLNLWGNEGGDGTWLSALAIQPQFKIPSAPGSLGNDHFELTCVAPFLVNLPAEFHLGLQPGVSLERNTANSAYVPGLLGAICLDRVILSNLDVYLEYAADVTSEHHVQPVQTLDLGGTYPLTDNITLDTGLNFGLNRASANLELLMGVSVRF